MKQATFASLAWTHYGKVVRHERFLAEMNTVTPCARLLGLIEPHYPKAGNSTQPLSMERMLPFYFMQHWFSRRSRTSCALRIPAIALDIHQWDA
jgi:IS5 family transposase